VSVWAVIPAAGRGERMGASMPKVLLPLLGKPVLWWTLSACEDCDAIDAVCLVAPGEVICEAARWGFRKLLRTTRGGKTRGESVLAGLEALPGNAAIAVIHDGARPCVTSQTLSAVAEAAREGGAASGFPARDTIQQAGTDGFVEVTPERAALWAVQTPQAFGAAEIRDAYRRARAEGFEATDDVAVARRYGIRVRLTAGDPGNIKVTSPVDLAAAAGILAARTGRTPVGVRVGIGTDTHRLEAGRPLILGGVAVPYARGLAGHSDADVLTHAVIDALLGAAALDDIGTLFPDTDERYRGADSIVLLREVCAKLRAAGLRAVNVDATVIAQRPRLREYIADMRARLAEALGIAPEAVSVKATTTEGLGPEGRGEGITAHAIAAVAQFR
jgi:2-C-methyl-D-erythritol 4-phosphate cytidylyltransferase/2-C-methyl-D-erythritol 2,4-cyclodiphosphate synthase